MEPTSVWNLLEFEKEEEEEEEEEERRKVEVEGRVGERYR